MLQLTPDEAKKEPCPFFRSINPNEVASFGQAVIYSHELCKGPACRIGWRWTDGLKTHGFCGAFGNPRYD